MIVVRSWWNLAKIVQDHGKIMIESWQDCDKILARTMVGSWQDHGGILTRSSKIMIEYWQYCDICDWFDQGSLYLYL